MVDPKQFGNVENGFSFSALLDKTQFEGFVNFEIKPYNFFKLDDGKFQSCHNHYKYINISFIVMGSTQRGLMKRVFLGLLVGTIIASNAFAGTSIIGTGSAKVNASPEQVTSELIKKIKVESHTKAFQDCITSNDYDICEMATAHTSCEQGVERALFTLTDIITEDNSGPVSVTISCKTDLEY